jgi:DNA-binding XRE family transcriptional regulator
MNTKLIRAWIEAGSPPLEDLAPALGMTDVAMIHLMNGRKFPDLGTQQLLANVFKKKVSDLFDDLPV